MYRDEERVFTDLFLCFRDTLVLDVQRCRAVQNALEMNRDSSWTLDV